MKPLVKFNKSGEKLQFVFKSKKIEYDLNPDFVYTQNESAAIYLIDALNWCFIDEVLNTMGIQKKFDTGLFNPPARCNWGCGTPEYEKEYNDAMDAWYQKRIAYLENFFRFN